MAVAMSTTTPPRKASPARIIFPTGSSAAISTDPATAVSSAKSRSGSTTGTSCASARQVTESERRLHRCACFETRSSSAPQHEVRCLWNKERTSSRGARTAGVSKDAWPSSSWVSFMNTTAETITVRPEDGAGRLDRWFRRHYPGLGHGRLEKLLRTGQVRVDGKRARAGDAIAPGQAIRVPPLAEPSTPPPVRRVRPQDEELLRRLVLYRYASAIVLNKPNGLAVQGGTKTGRHVDGLLDTLRFDSGERPPLVHRLDKDTSGVLLIARTPAAAAFFTRAFREETRLRCGRRPSARSRLGCCARRQADADPRQERADPAEPSARRRNRRGMG